MRFLVIVKANQQSEAGVLPPTELFAAMAKYNEELVNAGVMVMGEGLKPSSAGVRVKFDGDQREVIPGPFADTEHLVAGFWIWEAKSLDDAIAWLKRAPFGGGVEIELRPIHGMEDFGDNLTPELREKEAQLRARVEQAQRKAS